jgi:hypothetical protein
MGYFKRKQTKKKGKKGTKKYRGGAPGDDLDERLKATRAELDTKTASLNTLMQGSPSIQDLIDAGNNLMRATEAYEEVVNEVNEARINLIALQNPRANKPNTNDVQR